MKCLLYVIIYKNRKRHWCVGFFFPFLLSQYSSLPQATARSTVCIMNSGSFVILIIFVPGTRLWVGIGNQKVNRSQLKVDMIKC